MVRDLDQPREHAGNRDDSVAEPRSRRSRAETDRQVERLVAQVGERVPRVERDGRQDREHLPPEVLVDEGLGRRRELMRSQESEAGALQVGKHVREQRAVLARHHLVGPDADGLELLPRREGVGARFLHVPGDLRLEPRHPDHEEFIEVAAGDGEELQPLQGGHGRVARLLEDSVVEGEPRQLPVDEPARIGERLDGGDRLGRRHHRERRRQGVGGRAGGRRESRQRRCGSAVHGWTVHAHLGAGERHA